MKKQSTQVLAAMFLSFGCMPVMSFGHTVSFQGLGDLLGGSFISSAEDVSADGSVVVGWSMGTDQLEAFRWTKSDGIQRLWPPLDEHQWSQAYAVSADGSVVVGATGFDGGMGAQAFYWTQSNGIIVLPCGGLGCYACDVSADGSVMVGEYERDAFRWTQTEGIQFLGDPEAPLDDSSARGISADGSVIVGMSYALRRNGEAEAYRWENGVMSGLGDLPGWPFHSEAFALSSDGSVIVGHSWSSRGEEAFRWENGVMRGLGDLPGGPFFSRAYAVSDDGSIVVGFGSTSTRWEIEAFIWDSANGMRDLKDVLEKNYGLDLTGWTLSWASGISADGLTIVGRGINPDGHEEGWIATIPEPATLVLLGLGTALLRKRW